MSESRLPTFPGPRIRPEQKRLTAEQRAYAQQFDQKYIALMRSTFEVDEAEAEEHLRQAYLVAGFAPPRIRWFDSPTAFLLASIPPNIKSTMGLPVEDRGEMSIWVDVTDSLVNEHRIPIVEHLDLDVEDWEIIHGLGDDVYEELWAETLDSAVRESLFENVLFDMVYAYVGGDVWKNEWDWVFKGINGGIGAYYYAYHLAKVRFCHEGIEPNELIHFALFNELVSGYRLGQEEAWIVHRPTRMLHDEYGRWHSADGRCLEYRDGWGFYAWHGVLVPEQVILHPERLTKEDWLAENNLEVRRVLQERWGPDHFIDVVGGVCVDESMRGKLIAVDLSNDPEGVAHYVQVKDASTQRQYYLRVPPSIQRADEAVAWTFGLDEQDYHPAQEA